MSRTVTISCRSFNDLQYKVAAIKGVRGLTGLGLKDSRECVERITPGHAEVIKLKHDILEPYCSEHINGIKSSGLTVHASSPNDKVRIGLGDEIRKLITYATMSAQYDIGKALMDVMETYCPEPSPEFTEKKTNDENDTERE